VNGVVGRQKAVVTTALLAHNKVKKVQADFTMTKKQGVLSLVGICLLIVVLSAAGLVSDFLTRLGLDLDGLLLILCSLLMGLLFLIMLVVIAREQGWIPERHKKESAPPPASKPAAPRAAPVKPQSEEAVSVPPGEGK
jgi:hypothetical protein